jgi:hypothetical protein
MSVSASAGQQYRPTVVNKSNADLPIIPSHDAAAMRDQQGEFLRKVVADRDHEPRSAVRDVADDAGALPQAIVEIDDGGLSFVMPEGAAAISARLPPFEEAGHTVARHDPSTCSLTRSPDHE